MLKNVSKDGERMKCKSIELMRARIIRGLTQTGLAEKIGINKSLISRLESGRGQTSPANVIKICKALGAKFEDLFEIVEKKGA